LRFKDDLNNAKIRTQGFGWKRGSCSEITNNNIPGMRLIAMDIEAYFCDCQLFNKVSFSRMLIAS